MTNPPSPTDTRLALLSRQEAAEGVGEFALAQAYGRLGLLTEVWECVAADSPDTAREIAAFCAEAMEALSRPGHDRTAARIVRKSADRWGDYLSLLDPSESEDQSRSDTPPDVPPVPDEAVLEFDAAALFKLLTGCDAAPSPPDDDISGLPRFRVPLVVSDQCAAVAEYTGRVGPVAPDDVDLRKVRCADQGLGSVRAADPTGDRETRPGTALSLDPGLRETFLAEAGDLFERIESLVNDLGNGRDAEGILPEIGRCFHTLKGAAGSVGLAEVASRVHAMEDRLGDAPETLLQPLHQLLADLETVFTGLRQGNSPEETPDAETPAAEGHVRVASDQVDALMDLASELITRRGLWAAQAEAMHDYARSTRASRARMLATVDKVRDLPPRRGSGDATVRDQELAGLVRRLVDQAEDLAVLAETAQAAARPLAENSESLARLTLTLWESLQSIRVVPVRGLFHRLTRVAHDAARVEGRQVEIVLVGEETGLDRAVAEKAVEPLLHVVRNAVCHGIEPAAERARKGKSATGRVTLEASRAGNTLVLSVQDDGRGLDHEAIAAKGRRLGLIGPDEVPSVERLNALIFQNGFSTRDEASALAGRGVGMDVVSQEVGRLHGTVSLSSTTGRGTRLKISLPARLSLEQAMLVRVDGRSFAVPVALIDQVESFRPDEVDRSGDWPRVRIRDDWVPLVDAREVLGISPSPALSWPKVISMRADGHPLAVAVDAIEGTAELAIKPLGPLLAGHPVVSGTSLSADGEVILILNPAGLSRRTRDVAIETAQPPGSGVVLVVDDSISVRRVVVGRIKALGYEVEEASDGLDALGKLRNGSYCCVVSDLEMPRMDGFELLAELGRLQILPTLPVLLSSTRSDPETRRRAIGLGASDFLPKPIAPDELAMKVRSMTRRPAVGPIGTSDNSQRDTSCPAR